MHIQIDARAAATLRIRPIVHLEHRSRQFGSDTPSRIIENVPTDDSCRSNGFRRVCAGYLVVCRDIDKAAHAYACAPPIQLRVDEEIIEFETEIRTEEIPGGFSGRVVHVFIDTRLSQGKGDTEVRFL